MEQNSRISSAWTRQLLTSPWYWRRWNRISTHMQDTKLRLAIPAQEKLAATLRILATSGEFQKHSFISSAFRLPKMHCATSDKHVIKETLLIGQTYWESCSIIQQISPNSHWWFLADFSYDLRNHSMLWFLRSYDFSAMQLISYDFLARNRWEIIRFSAISVFTPSVISSREIGEKSPVWIRHNNLM